MLLRKKVVLLVACLTITACMVIINTLRAKEKLTDYNYRNKKEDWLLLVSIIQY